MPGFHNGRTIRYWSHKRVPSERAIRVGFGGNVRRRKMITIKGSSWAKPHPLLASGTMYVGVTESFHSLYLLPWSFPSVEGFLAEGCIDGPPPYGCHLASANENPRKRDGGEDTAGPRPCQLISISWWWSRSSLHPEDLASLQWLHPLSDHSSWSLLFPVLPPLLCAKIL